MKNFDFKNVLRMDIEEIRGKIKLLTGLRIGSGDDDIKIGGIDLQVIKDKNNIPYIPGSSIKGKVRNLLELFEGKIMNDGSAWSSDDSSDLICRIFGTSNKNFKGGPTRVPFCDCFFSKDSYEELKKKKALTEEKVEVTVNRIHGKGEHPRHIERIPAGAIFNFKITLKKFTFSNESNENNELEKKHIDFLLKGLKLLEMDSLGGSGSRGYGKIKFEFEDKEIQKKFDEISFDKDN